MKLTKMQNVLYILLLLQCIIINVYSDDNTLRHPNESIYRFHESYYSTGMTKDVSNQNTTYFTFEWSQSGYSIKQAKSENYIEKDILYQKTFGGEGPTIVIHVIDGRFIVFPRTIKSSLIKESKFFEMRAVTEIYDLEQNELVFRSEEYVYDHDIDLKYDYQVIKKLKLKKKQTKP